MESTRIGKKLGAAAIITDFSIGGIVIDRATERAEEMTETMKLPKPPTSPAPCRLYVILAREAPIAVIFRRGPSKRVQIVKWDTATDTFTPGQWFHGRIYERRCDLSPDGSLLIYFAQKINRRMMEDKKYTYAWTAISRPPYLTALALWPKGESWDGGGLFLSNHEVWLNHPQEHTEPHADHQPKGLVVSHNLTRLGEDDPTRYSYLERSGWQNVQDLQVETIKSAWGKAYWERKATGQPTDFEWHRTVEHLSTASHDVLVAPGIYHKPHSDLTLVMAVTLKGFHQPHSYSVRDHEGHEESLPGAEWADWDQQGRLVYAQAGKIYAVKAGGFGQEPPRELIDLNDQKPEPMEAPDWAKIW